MSTLAHSELVRLSPSERLTLIGDLWDSLSDTDAPPTPSQRAELLRRLDSFAQDSASGVTWDQLKSELADRAR